MAYFGNEPAKVAVKVGSGVITATELADDSITTADIIDDAITPNQLDDDGTGFQVGTLGVGAAVSGGHALLVSGSSSFGNAFTSGYFQSSSTGIGFRASQQSYDTLYYSASNRIGFSGSTTQRFDCTAATFTGDIYGNDRLYLGTKLALDMNSEALYVGSTTGDNRNTTLHLRSNDAPALDFDSSQNATFAKNVGIGVSPSATNSTHDSLNVGGNGIWSSYATQGAGGEMDIGHNFFYNASGNQVYISTDEATQYRQGSGKHYFKTASSGTAGNTISWSTPLTLNADSSATFAGTITNTPNTSGTYAMFVNQQNSAGWGLRVASGTDNDDYIIRGQDGSGNDKFQVKSGGNIVLGDDKLLVNTTGQTNINVAGISGWGAEIHNAYNSASDVRVYLAYANSSGRNSGMNITMDDANSGEYLASWNSGGVERFKMTGTGYTTFSGDVTLGGDTQLETAYTNLQLYMPDNATGLVLANGASNSDARNWGIYTNWSHWGALDFRVSSTRDAVAHTTQVLSLEKDGDMITQRIMPVADGTHDLGDNTKSWRKVYTDGILFNGDTSNDNMLDDYEEGTYTWKIYTSSGNSSNAAWQSRGGYTLAQYTKIGNMVTVSGRWEVDAQSNASTSSDYYVFMTVPFAAAGHGGSQPYSSVGAGTFNRAATGDSDGELKSAKPIIFQGDSYLHWQMASGTSSAESYIKGFSDSNFEGHFCITYRAA